MTSKPRICPPADAWVGTREHVGFLPGETPCQQQESVSGTRLRAHGSGKVSRNLTARVSFLAGWLIACFPREARLLIKSMVTAPRRIRLKLGRACRSTESTARNVISFGRENVAMVFCRYGRRARR